MTINNIFKILSDKILGNRYLEQQLTIAFEDIQRGESISDAMEATGGFPTLLIGAIRNGETTGTIDDAFRRLGGYYDKEVKRNVETMINALEPLSIIVLGGIFGMIALSIMLPLYDMISEIQ
jgi:type II secretory pathway component PulF